MSQPLSPWPAQRKYFSWAVHLGLAIFFLSFVRIQASSPIISQEIPPARPLEPDRPIERELAGGQSHYYQITLAEGQFAKLIVDQRGIDVAVKLVGADGKPRLEFDSDSRTHGQEPVALVAEASSGLRLEVQAKLKGAIAGRYEIRIEELRAATDDDRALQEARKLDTEFRRLLIAGRYNEAQPLGVRALEIREKIVGAEHRDIVYTLNGLAILHLEKGENATAERLFQRVLVLGEKVLGPEHFELARALNSLGNLYSDQGDYVKAERFYQRAVDIAEKALGAEHPNLASTLNNLANLYSRMSEYSKAEPLHYRALSIREKAFGPDHPAVANSLNNLAFLYREIGENAKAEPLYHRSLSIAEKALGPEHPAVANTLNNLGLLYYTKGDGARAAPLYQRALAIWEKALGPEHPDVARALNNLALIYRDNGEYAKAEPLYERSLSIKEKALGPEHANLASSLNNLADLYCDKGEHSKAEPLYQRALGISEKALGAKHPDVANTLNNLASFYRDRSDYAKAEPLYRRALNIRETALGPEHYKVAESLNDLAVLYAAKGDIAQAVACQERANDVGEYNLAHNLAAGSERQKLAYLAHLSNQTDFTFSLHSRVAPANAQALNLAFTTLLRRKGRGLDAMTDTIAALRRRSTPGDQKLFDQLIETRSQLAALAFRESNAAEPGTYRTQLRPLEEKVEELETELSARSSEFRAQTQPVTLSAVQAALPLGSALIEFVVYNPQEPQTEKISSPRYLAYLLAPREEPRWADIGEVAPIDLAIGSWREALRDPQRADVKQLARAVNEKVMRPVRSLLGELPGETRQLLIAPDGLLNLVPFAALVDEQNRYLIERYAISYLTSGRDLLRTQPPSRNKNPTLIVANPAFGRFESTGEQANQERAKTDETQIHFQPLPGTEGEAVAIKSVLPGAKVLLWKRATERAIKQARAPHILHIATHGFFLSDQETPLAETRSGPGEDPMRMSDLRLGKWAARIKDPLLRSGLALAGANHGKSGDDDGVLTALEVAGLDLWGTELVVLSACDTGVGEVKNGDGVYGLRRGLVLAGSETQVISLWPVSDKITRELMVAYYNGLKERQGRGAALRRVQLKMLGNARRQHPFYWAAFIQSGAWAILEGRR